MPFPTTSTCWANGRRLPSWHRETGSDPSGSRHCFCFVFFFFPFSPFFFFSLFTELLRHLHLVSWNVKRCVSHLLQELARFRLWWISGKSQFRSWGPTTENIYLFKLFIAFLKNSSLYYLSMSQKLKVHHELKVYQQHPARRSCRAPGGSYPGLNVVVAGDRQRCVVTLCWMPCGAAAGASSEGRWVCSPPARASAGFNSLFKMEFIVIAGPIN